MPETDVERIRKILEANKSKNFVQRVISPNDYPDISVPDHGAGKRGTHLMSYSEVGDGENKKYFVYPQIIQDPKSGALIRLDPKVAARHALDSGEFLPFDTAEEADWFSQNYKKVWE